MAKIAKSGKSKKSDTKVYYDEKSEQMRYAFLMDKKQMNELLAIEKKTLIKVPQLMRIALKEYIERNA